MMKIKKRILGDILILLSALITINIVVNSDEGHTFDWDKYIHEEIGNVALDTLSVDVDNIDIEKAIRLFLLNSIEQKLDLIAVDKHIKMLDFIKFGNIIQYGSLGVTLYTTDNKSPIGIRGGIILDSILLENKPLLVFTLYHELGHWFGLPHSENEQTIMFKSYSHERVSMVFENWDIEIYKFMQSINDNYNENDSTFKYPNNIYN